MIEFASAADGRELERSDASALYCPPEEDKTVQSDVDSSDIMTLVRKYGLRSDDVVPLDPRAYGDFSGIVDFHTAMNRVIEARRSFEQLPSAVRDRFANDPQRLLEFLADPASRDEAVELGLVNRPPEPPPEPPAAATQPAEPASPVV